MLNYDNSKLFLAHPVMHPKSTEVFNQIHLDDYTRKKRDTAMHYDEKCWKAGSNTTPYRKGKKIMLKTVI
jgi:hypothetical protein